LNRDASLLLSSGPQASLRLAGQQLPVRCVAVLPLRPLCILGILPSRDAANGGFLVMSLPKQSSLSQPDRLRSIADWLLGLESWRCQFRARGNFSSLYFFKLPSPPRCTRVSNYEVLPSYTSRTDVVGVMIDKQKSTRTTRSGWDTPVLAENGFRAKPGGAALISPLFVSFVW
jgi:hypothetical protein